ncbi:MAG TPA: hypothetical protein VGF14_07370 [Alphaproteobacteria bacterium]
MALSDVAICSRALLKIGAHPIQSFYDDRIEAEIALALYQPTRDALLSAYPWRFATTQITLPRLLDAPQADFSYAFQLPNDFLRILSAGSNGQSDGLVYRIVRNTLQTDSEAVMLNYIFRPDEAEAPPFFEQVLIAQLAAEFCLPLTENSSRADTLYKIANQSFDRAKKIDAYQDTPKALIDFNLIDARNA